MKKGEIVMLALPAVIRDPACFERIPEYHFRCDVGDVIERGGQLSLRSLPLVWPTSTR